jgi:hypothetical protein
MKDTKDQKTKGLKDHGTTDHGTRRPEEGNPKHQHPNSRQIPRSKFQLQDSGTSGRRERGAGRLQLLCSMIAVVMLCGCAGTRALRGGKAFTARNPAGGVSRCFFRGRILRRRRNRTRKP